MDNKQTFNYTYSAKQQDEVMAIRKKYAVPDEKEDKIALIRRLDAGVTQKATKYSLAVGVIGALIMGIGMSLAMTNIGEIIGMAENISMLTGIVIGAVGIAFVCAAYPIYNRITEKERKKVAPEIIRLTDEFVK